MKRLLALHPSPAMLVACLALFVALGGVSYGVATGFIDSREIRNNSIRTQDLRNNDIRAVDIRNSTIRGRDVALNSLAGGDIAESKLEKVPAAVTADNLGGLGKDAFVRSDSSPFVVLPTAPDWEPIAGETLPGYYKDPLGFVHLHGALRRPSGSSEQALLLPVDVRPGAVKRFPIYSEDTGPVAAGLTIRPDGIVSAAAAGNGLSTLVSLEGVTFRAGDSGPGYLGP